MIQSKDAATINTKKIFAIIFTGNEENILLSRLLKFAKFSRLVEILFQKY